MLGILIDPEDLDRMLKQMQAAGLPSEVLQRVRSTIEELKKLPVEGHSECSLCSAELKRLTDKIRVMEPLSFEAKISREEYGTVFKGTGDLEVQAIFLTMIMVLSYLTLEKHYKDGGKEDMMPHAFQSITSIGCQMAERLAKKGP